MRICIFGGHSGTNDEGMKNLTLQLEQYLRRKHQVLMLEPRESLKKDFWRQLRLFHPDIVHYTHGPTIKSLVLLQAIRKYCKHTPKVIASATKPFFGRLSKIIVPFVKPDVIFSQSYLWENFFQSYSIDTMFVPNGVDTTIFTPGAETEKRAIRHSLRIDLDEMIILHVGHIRTNRNLQVFKALQDMDGIQTVIVGGTTNPAEESLKAELSECGCLVLHQYFQDISILYKMADLYIFPVRYDHKQLPTSYNQIGAIDTPLSVLEAMACNLPVITTPFGALPRLFSPGNGYFVCEDDGMIFETVEKLCQEQTILKVDTRTMVEPFSWTNLIRKIEKCYENILSE